MLVIVVAICTAVVSSSIAFAYSIYDNIIQTTTTIGLQTSTAYCPGSISTDHTLDWPSVVSSALADYNATHGNAIAEWETDWNNNVGWTVLSYEGANSERHFLVLYSASGGENSFFSSGGNDYFASYDPAPITPFRQIRIMTTGDNVGNCDQTPFATGASTGGLSLTAADFAGSYKILSSTFWTTLPENYEGESVPTAPDPTPYTGTVDCGGETPLLMSMYQPGNWGAATLISTSLGRADWSYGLTSSPYSFTVDCGGTLASSAGTVDPTTTSGDWVCDVYGTEPYYCVLS